MCEAIWKVFEQEIETDMIPVNIVNTKQCTTQSTIFQEYFSDKKV